MAGFAPKAYWNTIRRGRLIQVLAVYLGTSFVVIEAVDILTDRLGLPDWFFPGAVAILLIGLPIIVTTALVQTAPSRPTEAQAPDSGTPTSESPRQTRAVDVAAVAKHWLTWRKAILGGVLAFALLGLVTTGYTVMRVLGIGPLGSLVATGVLDPGERIMLADFQSETSDTLLAAAATEAFRIDFAQSTLVNIAEPAYVDRVLRRMGKERGAPLDPATAREVAIREGFKAVVEGEINSAGTSFVVSARLVAADGSATLAAYRETASDSTRVIAAIDKVSKKLRAKMGESLKTIRANEPLETVTTSSLQALRKYSQGIRALKDGDRQRGVALLEEAVALDTTFAMAHRTLGLRALNASQRIAAMRKAYKYRDRLTDRERYLTLGTYHSSVTDDRQKAITAYRSLLEIYPNESTGINNLAGLYVFMRDYAGAEELYQRAAELDPKQPIYWTNLISMQGAQGKLDEAELSLGRFAEALPDHTRVLEYRSSLAVARGDYDAAEALVLELREQHGQNLLVRSGTSWSLALHAALRGQIAEAERRVREAIAMGEQVGFAGAVLDGTLGLANMDVWFRGATERAVRNVEDALERYPLSSMAPLDRPYLSLASFFALAGQPERARDFVAEYEAAIEPELRRRNKTSWHHTLGDMALAEERYQEAIAEYRVADESSSCSFCNLGVLGYAYDLAAEPDSAIAMYERFLTTPWLGRLFADAIFKAHIHERLGSLYEERGYTEKALLNYGRFLELWQDADSDLQVRVEAARRATEALSRDR